MRHSHFAALAAACLLAVAPAPALAARAPGAPATAATRDPSGTVGGPKLASRGIVVDAPAGLPALPKIKAASWVIADGGTGDVLAARDPHGHHLPASTLKVLTALALIPRLDPNMLVRPTQESCDTEGTKVGMTPKLQYKVSDLFHAMMMMSANDASAALAEAAGGMDRALAVMNAEARRINARDTLAGSPNGLDTDLGLTVKTQHTSSYDLVLMLREAMRDPAFVGYASKLDHHFPAPPTKKERKKGKETGGYPIHTHNRMLAGQRHSYEGMIAGKNGYTIASRQTFVAAAERGGRTIYVALMRADRPPSEYAAELLDWGFAAAGRTNPVGELAQPTTGDPNGKRNQNAELLPPEPLSESESARRWWLWGGGTFGALAAAAVLYLVLRRRES